MRGLIIADPWIGKIINGQKTWEIRGTGTKIRERITLIRKGSGLIVGSARLVDVVGPLSLDDLRASVDRHCVALDLLRDVLGRYDQPHAWVLDDVERLDPPVPYRHPSGAVIWVTLPDDCLIADTP